ncbi:MAG: 50S ribosomal protein L3 [Polyangia bacterium]|jgi:large subunit ribosomal protein L3|nr:50S ribosomal protein L3 [Polyangia bacterium]
MYKMGLLGKKVGMTQVFTEDGVRVPVTVVATGPCMVLAKRSPDKDGYSAVQLGFDDQKPSRVNRPDLGRFKKVESDPKAFVREIRLPEEALSRFEVGQAVKVEDVFAAGDMVDVTGHTQGKGYQGVIKRHHMNGSKATHGVHEFYRHGGSIGCRLTPGRVVKGRRMAGQMGNTQVTVPNLKVVGVRPEEGLLLIRGAIPGGKNNYVVIRYAQKKPLLDRA